VYPNGMSFDFIFYVQSIDLFLQLMALVEEEAPQTSDSMLQRDDKEELGLLARLPPCCNFRCRPGNGRWVSKLPTYVIRSMSHVLFGTKLNWLLLCVPFAIIGAQGVLGHVSTE